MKKILMIFFIIISIIGVSFLSSCEDDNLPYKEEGYYKYYIGNDNAYVVGLTELGMEQEALDFTAKLDGKNIVLGYNYRLNYGTEFKFDIESENLKKVYIIDYNNYNYGLLGITTLDLDKIIKLDSIYCRYQTDDVKYYFNCNVEFDSRKNFNNSSEYHQFYANVEYNLNYDNNDIYFIDDYDNELISYIPQNPEREGY
nr:hypothetical protein [Acholeplasmatales bacterium]